MVNYNSCCIYINNNPSLLKLNVFYKQISLIWLSSVKNGNDFMGKFVSIKHLCGYLILVLFIEVLFLLLNWTGS